MMGKKRGDKNKDNAGKYEKRVGLVKRIQGKTKQ